VKLIRNRADARWLPGRFNLAMFRLLAFFVCRTAKREVRPGLVLAVDRHQSALENYTVALWLVVSSSIYAFALLRRVTVAWAAAVLALPVALLVIQALTQLVLMAPQRWSRSHLRLNTFILMTVMIALSIIIAATAHWSKVVGWAGIVLAALNAVAAAAGQRPRPPH
jgi:hypothetical protein